MILCSHVPTLLLFLRLALSYLRVCPETAPHTPQKIRFFFRHIESDLLYHSRFSFSFFFLLRKFCSKPKRIQANLLPTPFECENPPGETVKMEVVRVRVRGNGGVHMHLKVREILRFHMTTSKSLVLLSFRRRIRRYTLCAFNFLQRCIIIHLYEGSPYVSFAPPLSLTLSILPHPFRLPSAEYMFFTRRKKVFPLCAAKMLLLLLLLLYSTSAPRFSCFAATLPSSFSRGGYAHAAPISSYAAARGGIRGLSIFSYEMLLFFLTS